MPRTRDEFMGGYNSPLFVRTLARLGIGQYVTINMGSFGLKPETICAYVEQAARILKITTRSHRDGETLFVGRFRNPMVQEMKLTVAERKQRVETVRQLAGTMSNWEIADRLGITPANLAYIARQNNISLRYYETRNTWSPERDEALIGYVLQGIPLTAIAEKFNVARSTIDKRLRKLEKDGRQIPKRQHGGYRHGTRRSAAGEANL